VPCLDENTLLELSEGLISPAALGLIEQHLDGCESCRRLAADAMRADTLNVEVRTSATLPHVDPLHYVGSRELSRGGMGRIRVATDSRLGRVVAIKEMLPGQFDQRRFVREARITARLQHPSIVKVHEAGTWPDGEPFYVMPFVQGRSLDKVISEAKTLEARLALLPHLLAVADAISSAHAEHIIHRDLKPANVLVGHFGETVVIDWGLAKDLAAPPEPESLDGVAPLTSDKTAHGTIVGTPAYMPPEQARGLPVDERADVYALGAMLDHVLAGKPAYSSQASEALRALEAGPPPPLRAREPRAPRELVTIAERAMARDPAQRYPTAKELADDLRRFQTGQLVGAHHYSLRQLLVRWLKRHRATVAVGAAAVVVVLVGGAVSLSRVVKAQHAAEESRGKTEELVEFILGDLHDKLIGVGRLDLLEDAAQRAVASYATRPEGLSASEEARLSRSHRLLGTVLHHRGRIDEALAETTLALKSIDAALARQPSNLSWQVERAAAHDALGEVFLSRGDTVAAIREFNAAVVESTRAAAADPTSPEWQLLRATSIGRLGKLHYLKGDETAAVDALRQTLSILEQLVKDHPTNRGFQSELAVARGALGSALFERGEVTEALALYRVSQAANEKLLVADPGNVELRRNLAIDHQRIGDMVLELGEIHHALDAFTRSATLHQYLVARDPENTLWQRDLSYALDGQGDAWTALGEQAKALAAYRASLERREQLLAKDRSHTQHQRDLSVSYDKVGGALQQLGDLPGALAEFRRSLALREPMVQADPSNDEWARDLAVSREFVAHVLLSQRDFAGALALYELSREFCTRQLETYPTDAIAIRDLALTHDNFGNLYAARGDAALAIPEYRRALEIFDTVPPEHRASPTLQVELMDTHEHLASAQRATGDRQGALRSLETALGLARALEAKRGEDVVLRQRVQTLTARVAAAAK
jgi:tetratricopeptide (TPR) repeat protein